ncbi:MAG: hypothetical protein ABI224_05770 [Acetobacteraceae bacterium]
MSNNVEGKVVVITGASSGLGEAEGEDRGRSHEGHHDNRQLRGASGVGQHRVKPSDWVEKVYKPDIIGKPDTLYKKPGYDPV